MIPGFDVSNWQSGTYDGGGGFTFGLAKLTEATGYKDPAADRHMAAILAQPIVPGGYHFSRPDLNPGTAGAYAEADWFWQVASSYGGARGMLLVNDAESAGGSLQWCRDWAGRLAWRAGGYNPWLYSYFAWLQSRGIVGSDLLQQDPLWLAWPSANGGLPFTCSMQQYGLTSVPGISGQVDANQFFGSLDQLKALTVGGDPVAIDPAILQEIRTNAATAARVVSATDAATDDANNPVDVHWAAGYTLSHVRAIQAQVGHLLGDEDKVNQAVTALTAQVQAQGATLQAVQTGVAALAQADADLKAELDTVAGQVTSGTPPNLSALAQAVAAVDGHLATLRQHLGDTAP